MAWWLFIVSGIVGSVKEESKLDSNDIFISVIGSILIISSTLNFIEEGSQTIALIAWMVVFIIFGAISYNFSKKTSFFYVYTLISTLFLVIATSMELDGSTLVYAFAVEAAIISVAGYIITRRLSVGYNLSILMIPSVIMSLPSIVSKSWNTGVVHDDFGILFIIGILLVGLGLFYRWSYEEKDKYNDPIVEKFYPAHIIIGSAYFLLLIWLSTKATFDNASVAIMTSLVVYTVIGIICYFYGLTENKKLFRYYGAVLLLFVVGRLLVVDVWNMELSKRVVTFVLIGLLFISTAFMGNKMKEGKEIPQ